MKMDLTFNDIPNAGAQFSFAIVGDVRNVHIEVYLDKTPFYSHDCPDPPCHEEISIPEDAGGKRLVFVATEPKGERVTRAFVIIGLERPAAYVTASA